MSETKKIKILFRHRSMEMGGVEKVMLSLLNNLDREKFDMTVLLSLNQGELRNEIPAHVRKLWLAEGKEDLSKNPLLQKIQLLKRKTSLARLLGNPEKIDREILKDTYDIEIGMTYNDFDPVLNSSNKNSKKIGWFHSEINIPGFEPLVPGILKNFPRFHHMVYCSKKIKDLMHTHHPDLDFPPESVIINAVPVDEILKKAEEPIGDFPGGGPVFVSIGRLHHRKGYQMLIDVHARLIHDGFPHKILLIGDGEEKENLSQQAAKLGVADSVILAGNRMNPYPYIKKADFYILSSKSEAWPLVIAEALILSKPIIATDTGDVAQMITHGESGLLIKYDENEMYSAMRRFLTDEKLIADLQNNSKQAAEQFDSRTIFSAVENLFMNIVKQ